MKQKEISKSNMFHVLRFMFYKGGFSLLELLIYTAVISISAIVIVNAFLTLNRGMGQATAQSKVNSSLRFAIAKISSDVRAASTISTPSCSPSCTGSTLVMTIGADTITYDLSSGQIRRQVNSVTPIPTLTGTEVIVNSLNFTRLQNTNTVLNKTITSIETVINMSYNTSKPDYQYSATERTTSAMW